MNAFIMFFYLTSFFLNLGGFTEMVVDRWMDRKTGRQLDGLTGIKMKGPRG